MNRKQLSQLFRPVGPKTVGTVNWAAGGKGSIATGGIDLSLPIMGLRLIFKGRVVIGVAAMTSVNPEGLLNLIPRIAITGTNKRQNGNAVLWDIDLATLHGVQHLFDYRNSMFDINGTLVPIPTMPFPAPGAAGYFNGATGTYDFRIIIDIPFGPLSAIGGIVPGFLVRNEEWKESLQLIFEFGNQLQNAQGSLGLAAATTTITFTSFGAGTGVPTIDVYSLPVIMGQDLKDMVVPGFFSRVSTPIDVALQSAGTNRNLLNLQKQKTPRVFLKQGTTAFAPAFATLTDTNVTALGISLGGNRSVRNKVDIFAHKMAFVENYDRDPIQGYTGFDFMLSQNPDSAYPGAAVGEGTTLQLISDTTGVAGGYGLIIQEQTMYDPDGALFNF